MKDMFGPEVDPNDPHFKTYDFPRIGHPDLRDIFEATPEVLAGFSDVGGVIYEHSQPVREFSDEVSPEAVNSSPEAE